MVSLINGITDTLNGEDVDKSETNNVNIEKKIHEVKSNRGTSKTILQSITSNVIHLPENVHAKALSLLKDDSRKRTITVVRENPSELKIIRVKDADNDLPDKSEVVNYDGISSSKEKSPTFSGCATKISIPSATNSSNVIVLSGNFSSALAKTEGLKGGKLFLLNNNVLKSINASEFDDRMNIICLPQNVNDIKQIDLDKQTKTIGSNSGDTKKVKAVTTVPNFVQIAPSVLKNLKSNIKLTPLKIRSDSTDILRTKLTENNPTQSQTDRETYSKSETLEKNISNIVSGNKRDSVHESPSISEARGEYMKYRKKLIQAAIHPRMPTKVPLLGYEGPTYSCEECDDTFVCEDSLNKHKDRRSVLFTYGCPVCKTTLEFYNRCMFLLHVRSHDGVAVKASLLTISMIPANKLNFHVFEEEDEQPASNQETISATAPTPPVFVPPVRRKIYIRSIEKPINPATLRIVKTLKKKEPESTTMNKINKFVPDGIDSRADDTCVQNDSKQAFRSKSPNTQKFGNKSTKKLSDETSPLKPNEKTSDVKRTSKIETDPELKSESSANKKTELHKVTPNEKKKLNEVPNAPVKSNANTSPDDIILTSSDEEEIDAELDTKGKLVSCRDCRKEVSNLTKHYKGENRPKKEYPCDQCKYFNSSACALSAHVRMHTKTQPYVCPDCGYFFSTLETFLIHVKEVCFYHFKAIRFKCPVCSLLKPSVPQFAEHLNSEHTREVFKCDSCMTSSYTRKVVEQHMKKVHSDKQLHILEGYWCNLCPNVLVSKPLIQHHVNKHVYSLQYLRYVYICKSCKKFATGRMSKFYDHYQNHCPQIKIDDKKYSPKFKKLKPIPKVPDNTGDSGTAKVEEVVEKDPLSMQVGEADKLKAELVPKIKLCIMCRNTNVNENLSLFCSECVRFVDVDDASEGADVSKMSNVSELGRPRRKFKCKLCKRFMNRDWPTITQHFESFHQSDFDVGAKSRVQMIESTPSPITIANRKRKSSLAKFLESSKVSKIESQKYKCAKCEITSNDRIEFHEHIVTHKSQTNSEYQCLECGMCFIVIPSLEKHLIIEHKMKERELPDYLKENGIFMEKEKVEERKLVENQCEVCFTECGTKQAYDKHIRTHGMAFLTLQSKSKS